MVRVLVQWNGLVTMVSGVVFQTPAHHVMRKAHSLVGLGVTPPVIGASLVHLKITFASTDHASRRKTV
jgi:hypothetical protein